MFVLKVALPAFRLQRVKEFTVAGDFSVHTQRQRHLLLLLLVFFFFFIRPPFVFHVLSANLHKLLLDVKAPRVVRGGGGGRVQGGYFHAQRNKQRLWDYGIVRQWDRPTVITANDNDS